MLDFLIKFHGFLIYTAGVVLFYHFLNICYLSSVLFDWILDETITGPFDYIVIGAGSAGAIVAAELAKSKGKVLLIEAGASPPPFADIPVITPLFQQSPYDWRYKTVGQKHACKALVNNQSLWPMGRILGGSSRLNFMAYVEGHPEDYSGWFEDYKNYRLEEDKVSDPPWTSELNDAILKSIDEIFERDRSLNFQRVKLTMENGRRWSTDKLLVEIDKKRLKVLTNTLVEKILFSKQRARGVKFSKWNRQYEIRARKGVIVSAGAIGSPKLLMLSGIGPKEDLEKLKINVVKDLPVGKNLIDHILTGLDLVVLNRSSSVDIPTILNPKSVFNYLTKGQGTWTFAGIETVGTMKTTSESTVPDIQFIVMPVGISQDNGVALRKSMGISDKIFEDYFAPLAYKTAVTIAPLLLHPKSTGEVRLTSLNPLDDPIINPNYLSDPKDVSTLVKGVEFISEILNTNSMKSFGASIYTKQFPGCEKFKFGTRDYWKCYIRHLTLTVYHPAGTCRMESVVDQSFRVLGIKNLFVVDASVLPKLPSGNPHATIMMLAKKASKLIKELNKLSKKSCNSRDFLRYIFLLSQ